MFTSIWTSAKAITAWAMAVGVGAALVAAWEVLPSRHDRPAGAPRYEADPDPRCERIRLRSERKHEVARQLFSGALSVPEAVASFKSAHQGDLDSLRKSWPEEASDDELCAASLYEFLIRQPRPADRGEHIDRVFRELGGLLGPTADRLPVSWQPQDKGKGKGKGGPPGLVKPRMSDTVKANVYADNWFVLYINGKLTAVDSIDFIPHNVISVDILPEYPMTIAVMARDNADPKTGLEYGDHIGDGGFILKFGDGTVTSAKWKAKCFFTGPLGRAVKNPKVRHEPIPQNWWATDFDDSKWGFATEYTEERVGPKEPFYQFDFKGAKWIWTEDLDLDNTVIFRHRVEKPGWKPRWNTKPNLDVSGALPWRAGK